MPVLEPPLIPSSLMRLPGRSLPGVRTNGHSVNIGKGERWLSVLGGVALFGAGLNQFFKGRLGFAALSSGVGSVLTYRGMAGHSRLYDAVGSVLPARDGGAFAQDICICSSVTIRRPAEEIYRFCREPQNWRQLVPRAESLDARCDHRSRDENVITADPAEWGLQIINDIPGKSFEWSCEGGCLHHEGIVEFEPASGDRGTEVGVSIRYRSPVGAIGVLAAKMFQCDPQAELEETMRLLKQMIEAGEIATNAGPSGRLPAGERRSFLQRREHSGERSQEDVVTQASMESFPASDPPAWGGTIGT